jgi:hypothetical protein
MQARNSLSAAIILGAVVVAPAVTPAQTMMMMAPLPPPRPSDLALARPADATALDPDAALRGSVATRGSVERHQRVVMQRPERDVPMPRPVPAIIAPTRP